jgi:hypothetical protein
VSDQVPHGYEETAPIGVRLPAPVTAPVPTPVPTAPLPTAPAGWYTVGGEQHWWDGFRWTGHRAPLAAPQVPIVVTDARTDGVEIAFAWVLTLLSAGYLLPWAIAATRGKSNSGGIGLLTFFLGWTFVGWVVALVMACSAHRVVYVQHR